MSVFSKAKKYRKPSRSIDEKVKLLNQDLEKTGVVVEAAPANSSTGVYSHTTFENDGDNVPKVVEDVPDPTGFRDNGNDNNADDIDPDDSSTWATGGQSMNQLINPNTLPVENGPDLTDQPVVATPDLTGFKGLLSDDEDPTSDMNQYAGMMKASYWGVWGTSYGVIGPGNTAEVVMGAFEWPTGPAVSSGHPDYPAQRGMFGFYRTDDDATYFARLKYKEFLLSKEDWNDGSAWVPYKCWVTFNSYGFGVSYADYTGIKSGGKAYVTVQVYKGAQKYNSQEPGKPKTTVVFQGGLGDPNYHPGDIKKDDDLDDFWDWWKDNEGLSDEAAEKAKEEAEQQQNELNDKYGHLSDEELADLGYKRNANGDIVEMTDEEKEAHAEAKELAKKLEELEKDIAKFSALQKQYEHEAKMILLKFGIDAALTIFGGAIIKGVVGAATKLPALVGLGSKASKIAKGADILDDVLAGLPKGLGIADDTLSVASDAVNKASNLATKADDIGNQFLGLLAGSSDPKAKAAFTSISSALDSGVPDAVFAAVNKAKVNVLGYKAVTKATTAIPKLPMIKNVNIKPQFSKASQSFDLGGSWTDISSHQFNSILKNPGNFGIKPGTSLWKSVMKKAKFYLSESLEFDGEVLVEGDPALGWASPKHTDIDKDEKKRWFKEKDIQPEYPKKKPPKMVHDRHPDLLKGPKKDAPKSKDLIKLSDTDLLRNYKVKPDQIKKCRRIITRLNSYITRNPGILIHLRERYPKDDPRLAKLNYKLDMQNEASDEYMSKHFPENEKLFNRVVKATQRSITLTDPKTYKDKKGKMTSYKKLLRVDYVLNEYDPKDSELKIKKIKSDKKSIGRFFRKPKKKTKGDILKDKMAVLDKEMKKTMPDW